MDEFNQLQDALLDGALNELSITPPPPDFTAQVMANIHSLNGRSAQTQTVPTTPIQFRLQFLDIALALFWSLTLIVIWITSLWWTGLLQPDWLPQMQAGFSLVDQLPLTNSSFLLVGIFLLLLEMSLLGLVGVNLLGERPSAL